MLASKHLASCDQIRISTSGLHPQLDAHPKFASTSSPTSNKRLGGIHYGSTSFQDLQSILGWSDETLHRNQLVSNGPRNFLTLDRKMRGISSKKSNHLRSSNSSSRFDLVLCCSKPVFEAACQYYTSSSLLGDLPSRNSDGKDLEKPPHTLFVVFIDSKYFREASATTNSSSSASTATDINNNNNMPTQGTLFTSLVIEVLDLVHLRTVQGATSADNNTISNDSAFLVPQHVMNSFGYNKWKEDFGKSLKQFEQFRRVEVLFRPFVI